MSLTPFTGHNYSLSSAPLPPDGKDGKDGKQPPGASQAIPRAELPPQQPLPAASDARPLRDRVRKRGEHESEDAAAFHPKRAKAPVDYARLTTSPASDATSPQAPERKSQDAAGEARPASAASMKPIKLRKPSKLSGDGLAMNAAQPVAELRRLLGLDAHPSTTSSASSSSSAPASGVVAPGFEPAIDAQTLAQTLRKTYLRRPGGSPAKFLKALDTVVPSLRGMPPAALEVAARAIGALCYSATARKGCADLLIDWCRELGTQGAPFARALIGQAGDGIAKAIDWTESITRTPPSAGKAQVMDALLVHLLAEGEATALAELVRKVMDEPAFAQESAPGSEASEKRAQFFNCLGKACQEQAVPADQLCALIRPYVANPTAWSHFAAFCDGLWGRGMNPQQYNALVGLWLEPGGQDAPAARQFVMGATLAKFLPPQDFMSLAKAARTHLTDFRDYKSYLMGHYTHLLEAARLRPQRLDALARAWPRELDGLLKTFALRERAELMRGIGLALLEVDHAETCRLFFDELVHQLIRTDGVSPGGEGEALLSAVLEDQPYRARHPVHGWDNTRHWGDHSRLLEGYFNAVGHHMARLTEAQAREFGRLGSRHMPHKSSRRWTTGNSWESHPLATRLLAQAATTPQPIITALAEGFVREMLQTGDLPGRLARWANGLAYSTDRLTDDAIASRDAAAAAAAAIGRGTAWGLGGAATNARALEACMAALVPNLGFVPDPCVTALLTGLAAGLGGASTPPEVVRHLAQALHDARASFIALPDANQERIERILGQQLGPQRFDQALLDAARAPDRPVVQAAPAAGGSSVEAQMAAWRADIAQLGPPPATRPALPAICAHDREAARLWLALASLDQALRTEVAPSEQPLLKAELDTWLVQLQAHLPPASPLSPEDMAHHLKAFQRQAVAGLTPAMQMHDALALGWRLGLDRSPGDAHDAAAAAVRLRTQRLLQLAAPPATGAGTDPVLAGLMHAATRPRQALSAQAPRVVALLRAVLDEARVDLRQDNTFTQRGLMGRFTTALEWILRSMSPLGPRAEMAQVAAEKLWNNQDLVHYVHQAARSHHHPAQGASTGLLEPLVGGIVRGLDARHDATVLEPLVMAIASLRPSSFPADAHPAALGLARDVAPHLARGLGRAIGRGEPLQAALRIVAARAPEINNMDTLLTGLCDHDACPADVLFKTARSFEPAQKIALLGKGVTQAHWRAMATYLAAPPPAGHLHNHGGAALTDRQTYEWAMALSLACRQADPPMDLERLEDAMKKAALLPGNPPGTVPPDSQARKEKANPKCLKALNFVRWPSTLIRDLNRHDMTVDQRLAWLKILYRATPMTGEFAMSELVSLTGVQGRPSEEPEGPLRIESVFTLVQATARELQLPPLISARNFMLDQLRGIQQEIVTLDNGQPDMDHTERYLRASEAVTGLYAADIYGQAIRLPWAFQVPPADAPQAAKDAFEARARENKDSIRIALMGLAWEITHIEGRLAHEKARQASSASLLKLSTELTAAPSAAERAAHWKSTLDAAALELRRASLLPQTLEGMLARMKQLRSTLQAVQALAGVETAATGPDP